MSIKQQRRPLGNITSKYKKRIINIQRNWAWGKENVSPNPQRPILPHIPQLNISQLIIPELSLRGFHSDVRISRDTTYQPEVGFTFPE
tara:strand:+ start:65 stop:328 length:264 start_codon:yes stop_codon:yes gene_type:complete